MEANIWMIDDQILFQIYKFQVHDPDMLGGSWMLMVLIVTIFF